MTESLDFAITKRRLIVLLSCLFFSGLLLYAAGIVTGMLVKPGMVLRSSKVVAPEKSASEQKRADSKANITPDSSVPPGTEKASSAGLNGSQANKDSPASLRLSVQVASFLELVRAQRLTETLKQQGFGPISIGQSNVDEETWHVVWLGPYQDWDNASQIVAELQRSYDLQPVIRAIAAN
jgi:cell division septation protein DedD